MLCDASGKQGGGSGSQVRAARASSENCCHSPNYTLKLYAATSVQAQADFLPADFLSGLEQPATPVLGGVTLSASSAITIACDEAAGAFDTVSLFWNRGSFPAELYVLAAYRMA